MRSRQLYVAVLSTLFGFDFFISYRRSEAHSYADELHRVLTAAGFICFIDREEALPGDPLTRTITRALRRSRFLLAIVTPGVAQSDWVMQELGAFRQRKRAVIPVDVGGFLKSAVRTDASLSWLRDISWLDESAAAVAAGTPSAGLIEQLEKARARWRVRKTATLSGWASLITLVVASFVVAEIVRTGARDSDSSRAQSLIRQAYSRADSPEQRIANAQEAVRLASRLDPAIQSSAEQALRHGVVDMGGIELFSNRRAGPFFLEQELQRRENTLALVTAADEGDRILVWQFARFLPPDFPPAATLTPVPTEPARYADLGKVALSPDGRRIAAIRDIRELVIWQIDAAGTAKLQATVLLPPKWIPHELYWLGPTWNALATNSGFVRLHEKHEPTFDDLPGDEHVVVSEDGEWVFAWSKRASPNDSDALVSTGQLWSAAPAEKPATEITFDARFNLQKVQFSADGCYVAFVPGQSFPTAVRLAQLPCRRSPAQNIEVWDAHAEGPPEIMQGEVRDVVFSPDGQHALMVGPYIGAQLLYLDRSRSPQPLHGHYWDLADEVGASQRFEYVLAADFSKDGRWLATGGRDILMWDLRAAKPFEHWKTRLVTGEREIDRVELSVTGRFLFAGGASRMLWDLNVADIDLRPIQFPATDVPGGDLSSAMFSPDGRWFLTFTANPPRGRARGEVWPLLLNDLRQFSTHADRVPAEGQMRTL